MRGALRRFWDATDIAKGVDLERRLWIFLGMSQAVKGKRKGVDSYLREVGGEGNGDNR